MPGSSAGLKLTNLAKNFGALRAVDGVDLDLPEGRFVCLLGPSGCGKTTLLRLVAGLETPDSGEILFDGRGITDVPSHKRDFGMVFQSLALFPHLSVAENISYALRIRGQSKAVMADRVAKLLDMVHLPGVGDRRISQLSGGQRQRVAIARALAIEPRLFLLDEPLSALDAKLREAMQVELRQLQRSLGITTIVVTHDQREAMTMADHVVVMKDGKVLQHGAPLEIYRQPENAFVADFIGTSNLLPCRILTRTSVEIFGRKTPVAGLPEHLASTDQAILSIRPEDLHVIAANAPDAGGIPAVVTFIRDLGSEVEIMLAHDTHELIATIAPKDRPDIAVGDPVMLDFSPDACTVVTS